MGVSALRLLYPGSVGYLEPEQRQAVIAWLETKNYWNLAELQGHIQDEGGVADLLLMVSGFSQVSQFTRLTNISRTLPNNNDYITE